MNVNLNDAIDLLSRTPGTLRAMLNKLPPPWLFSNEGEQTWTPFEVLGHLIHGEKTDWVPRIKIILEQGESQAFAPFDRFAQLEAGKGKTLEELLDTFEQLRASNLRILKDIGIEPSALIKTGMHPELGRVTLEELIATWVVHDLDHLVQISRTLAKQYREEVGPWKAYLSVLK